ncbi:MAG: putative repeat protein [Thermoleophilia bacterium]|nr:putative repeat protein [Thermoleophilia bacterium]
MAAGDVAPAGAQPVGARAAAAAPTAATQTRQKQAITAAAADGTVTAAEQRTLVRAGLSAHQVSLLKTALTRASDGQRKLTPAEVTAVLRDGPLPDPTQGSVQRLINASRDGRLTRKERTTLRGFGITAIQLDRLGAAIRTNRGRPLTREQAMTVLTGTKAPVAPPAANPENPAGGVPGGGGTTPAPTSNVGDPALLPAPQALSAANADGYRLSTFPSSGGSGGQADAAGNLYVAAGAELRIFGPDNKAISVTKLPFAPQDVAPGPNGDYIYAVEGTTPRKLLRQGDGSYAIDPTFQLGTVPYGGKQYAAEGIRIATDHSGNLFVADGMWTGNLLNTVIKFDASGKYQTRFGEYADGNKQDAASWEQGKFYWGLGGIAVSPDGTSVYTTEVGNSRVQRWDAQANGTYASTKMWGNTQADDPDRVGSSQPGKFGAPYDIGLDGEGNVYVMNTTAAQIQKFTRDGQYITGMFMGNDPNTQDASLRGHGIAVTTRGDAVSTETGRMMEHVG